MDTYTQSKRHTRIPVCALQHSPAAPTVARARRRESNERGKKEKCTFVSGARERADAGAQPRHNSFTPVVGVLE